MVRYNIHCTNSNFDTILDNTCQEKEEDDLVKQMESLKMEVAEKEKMEPAVSCNCTRKCKTKACACFSVSLPCSASCHPHINDCTNLT